MRKVCVVVGSRANYSSIKSVMAAIKKHSKLKLQLVVGASALLDRYGAVVQVMEADGFVPDATVHMLVEGETPLTMAKSTGLGLLELATVFDRLKPDIVVTVGDRFETLATAIAATYMNIPLAHTMGGEVSGTIDESIRHAVTKLAHLHFPANDNAAKRILRMGEDPKSVHMVGCPRMDIIDEIAKKYRDTADKSLLRKEGVGGSIDFTKPFLLVMQHPVTTEFGDGEKQIQETLTVVETLKMPTVMLWPNADAGSEDIARGMRKFREKHEHGYIRFYKNLPLHTFIPLMMHTACMIGNSSAAIREGSFLGTPAVNIGTRQTGRDHSKNVLNCGYSHTEILKAVKAHLKHGRYKANPLYGDGDAGKKIAAILASCPLSVQKRIQF